MPQTSRLSRALTAASQIVFNVKSISPMPLDFLSFSFADLEIVIKEASRIDRHAFPTLAHILDCEIREFDFLAS